MAMLTEDVLKARVDGDVDCGFLLRRLARGDRMDEAGEDVQKKW